MIRQTEINAINAAARELAKIKLGDGDYARLSLERIAYAMGWREAGESGGLDGEAWTRVYVTPDGDRVTCWLSGHYSDTEICDGGLGFDIA